MIVTKHSEQVFFGSFKDNRKPTLHMVAAVFLPNFDPVSTLLFALFLRGHGYPRWAQTKLNKSAQGIINMDDAQWCPYG